MKIFVSLCLVLSAAWIHAGIKFAAESLELRKGESAMVAFSVDSPVTDDWRPETSLHGDQKLVKLLRPAVILKGESTGFCRIRAVGEGKVRLRIDGDELPVLVRDEALTGLLERMRPEITTPVRGAALWGGITVGAEVWVGAPGVDRSIQPQARLILPGGERIEASRAMPPVDGPFWRLSFEVDCSKLESGAQDWTVEISSPLDPKERLVSHAHRVRVIPAPGDEGYFASGECESTLDAPRPERFDDDPPGVGFDQDASGARHVNLYGYRPEWTAEFEVPAKASYQMVLVAKGTLAASAFPSLEIIRGEDSRRLGTGRLAGTEWHRIAIGSPIRLDAGKQVLGVRIGNSMNYRGRVQRHAFIDRFELRKVPSAGGASSMMMAGMSMAGMQEQAGGKKSASKKKRAARGLRVAFSELFDGRRMNQAMRINARLSAANLKRDDHFKDVMTALVINGKPFATRRGRRPWFEIFPHDLKAGENELQLVSVSPGGGDARSSVQRLRVDSPTHPEKELETAFAEDRFPATRGHWRGAKRRKIDPDSPFFQKDQSPAECFVVGEGGKATGKIIHRLPDHLEGDYRISLQVGQAEAGGVPLHCELIYHGKNERRVKLGEVTPGDAWVWKVLKRLELRKGRKELVIKPAKPGDCGDRRSAIGGVSLGRAHYADVSPPRAELRYPRASTRIDPRADAIVLSCFDETKLQRAEIFVDGRKQPVRFPLPPYGDILLPWDTSGLKPGTHELVVRVWDASGKQVETPGVKVEVESRQRLAGRKLLELPYERAMRLAERLGFGADDASLCEILVQGEEAWLKRQLARDARPGSLEAVDDLAAVYFRGFNDYEVRGRVLTHALLSRRPARARFVLWAQNHFSTWMAKTGSYAKWREHELFDGAGFARFNDLLLLSSTSPAMMVYLDQQNSLGRQLNENYARELLELHTVGVEGGYAQEDVTQLAHLLTGWGAQREATMDGSRYLYRFRFAPLLNETPKRRVFGLELGEADFTAASDDRILQFLEMLVARPQAAEFLSAKLAAHYFTEPSDALLERLRETFLRTQGDFAELVRVIASADELMVRELEPKFLQPVEFGIVRQRAAGIFHPWSINSLGDRSGRNLFDRATPDGYPEENAEYAGSNFQLQKWRFSKELEGAFGNRIWWPWCDQKRLDDPALRQAVGKAAALVILKRPLGERSAKAFSAILGQAAETEDHNQRRRLIATFLTMLPEAQSR